MCKVLASKIDTIQKLFDFSITYILKEETYKVLSQIPINIRIYPSTTNQNYLILDVEKKETSNELNTDITYKYEEFKASNDDILHIPFGSHISIKYDLITYLHAEELLNSIMQYFKNKDIDKKTIMNNVKLTLNFHLIHKENSYWKSLCSQIQNKGIENKDNLEFSIYPQIPEEHHIKDLVIVIEPDAEIQFPEYISIENSEYKVFYDKIPVYLKELKTLMQHVELRSNTRESMNTNIYHIAQAKKDSKSSALLSLEKKKVTVMEFNEYPNDYNFIDLQNNIINYVEIYLKEFFHTLCTEIKCSDLALYSYIKQCTTEIVEKIRKTMMSTFNGWERFYIYTLLNNIYSCYLGYTDEECNIRLLDVFEEHIIEYIDEKCVLL